MTTLDEVREAAMKLPLSERVDLVEELASSLPLPPDCHGEDTSDLEFARTILQRAEAYDRGETIAVDWRETIEQMRTSLERKVRDAAQS
jgi:hypothetical protein